MNDWVGITLTLIIIPSVGYIISKLINLYFQKAKELETEKDNNVKKSIANLDEAFLAIRSEMQVLRKDLKDYKKDMVLTSKKVEELSEKIRKNVSDNYNISRNIQDQLKQIVRSELIELSKRVVLIRDKKDGNGA